jgi:flagellar motor protein MotB
MLRRTAADLLAARSDNFYLSAARAHCVAQMEIQNAVNNNENAI